MTRHGATPYNDKDLLQGRIDIGLSERGIRDSELLAERMKDISIDMIFISPLSRARKTAEIVNRHHNSPFQVIDSLIEMDMGQWEGRDFFKVVEEHPEIYREWISNPDASIPGGESFNQVYRRVKAATCTILGSGYANILIVAHAMVNRAMLGNMMSLPPLSSRRFRTENCSYSKLRLQEVDNLRHIVVDSWNCSEHLGL